eukprot:scaffold7213_cov166-Amphora_coffeaeformis.AAC.18
MTAEGEIRSHMAHTQSRSRSTTLQQTFANGWHITDICVSVLVAVGEARIGMLVLVRDNEMPAVCMRSPKLKYHAPFLCSHRVPIVRMTSHTRITQHATYVTPTLPLMIGID